MAKMEPMGEPQVLVIVSICQGLSCFHCYKVCINTSNKVIVHVITISSDLEYLSQHFSSSSLSIKHLTSCMNHQYSSTTGMCTPVGFLQELSVSGYCSINLERVGTPLHYWCLFIPSLVTQTCTITNMHHYILDYYCWRRISNSSSDSKTTR